MSILSAPPPRPYKSSRDRPLPGRVRPEFRREMGRIDRLGAEG